MLRARSPEECHLYMGLHPCTCGAERFAWQRHYLIPGAEQTSVYEGECPGCGEAREFRFAVPDTLAPPFTFGGDEPSQVLDPYQFLTRYHLTTRVVPSDPAVLPESQRARYYAELRTGIAALREVLKFIPADAAAMPADAFTSEAGRAAFEADPEQFARERLEGLLDSHQETLAAYQAAVRGTTPGQSPASS
ncbi:hypothetical protein GCM10027280_41810 [Micromonospora polyrhachis]|uniref:Uncharacterized protein n=1 Tax=Micromonospora polyrhachis TaxID=1282883 RepID=A0A7W7WN01_9ACTN|nr:hypothetical protein [Micromonospora polyrhachis]MBB4957122.1 hypothetical protein [Micromonospora polyrhachis]